MPIPFVLTLFAFVFFVIAAFGVNSGRFNLVAAGLACLTAAALLGGDLGVIR